MKSIVFYILLIFFINTCLFGQNDFETPYDLSYGKEITLSTIGLGTLTAAYILSKKKEPLSPEIILGLDRNEINKFDRRATFNWSKKASRASDVFLISSMVLPFVLFSGENVREDYGRFLLLGAESFIMNTGLTDLTKEIAQRKRPFVYNPDVPMSEKTNKSATTSFFSGHTSLSASSTYFFATTFTNYYPDSRWKPLVWSVSAVIPALTGFLRYWAGKHYFTDIIVGYVVGAAAGILVPTLHNKSLKFNR